jgi:predicted nucleic acid-binding protein
MSVDAFFDTNILLYGYDLDAGPKRDISMDLLEQAWREPSRYAVSIQVLQEFQVNFVRAGYSREEAKRVISDLCRFRVVENTLETFGLGLALQERWQLSLWDAMILATAQVSGAKILYSEDFSDGQDYGGVRLVNPFGMF